MKELSKLKKTKKPHFFYPSSIKQKKDLSRENLFSRKIKFSSFNTKNYFIFSQKKAFLIFQEAESPKKFLIFP